MLARLSPTLPQGPEWVYEPRWDGFRGLLVRRGESVRILSRNGRLLEPYFPELFSSALRPPREVLDRWENPRSQERQAGVLGPA
jgi:ATP-dependent DNA ligase